MKILASSIITIAGLLLAGATVESITGQVLSSIAGLIIFWLGGRCLITACQNKEGI